MSWQLPLPLCRSRGPSLQESSWLVSLVSAQVPAGQSRVCSFDRDAGRLLLAPDGCCGGARNLQVAVHTLRCSLRGCGPGGSDETILFRHNQYLLNPALSIVQDVDAFRAAYERGLRAARAGRTDEALQAFEEARTYYLGDYLADPYEEWASTSRMAFQDRWLHVLERLGALYSEAGTWEQAIASYRELLAVDCYREDVYRRLMGCYAAAGRPAEVKQTYLTCRGYLRRDLHLAPAAETTLLYQQLIQQSTPGAVH